ncbi:MAG TPA: hypothetical protein VFF76_09750 [Holophagaceae bacterium]|jgi:hypothetical protein|nr:hypothetical protein [Holophagaceae bacterium]
MTAKGKGPLVTGPQNSRNTTPKDTVNPQAWQGPDEILLTDEAIREAVTGMLELARHALPGSWASCLVCPWPLVAIDLDFDGAGGILVNRFSLDSETGRAIFTELQRVAPDRVRVGQWTGGVS